MHRSESAASPTRDALLSQLHLHLHDLCQPLTALQCRLELGQAMGHPGALREAVDGGLEETQRMFEIITQVRDWLAREEETNDRS